MTLKPRQGNFHRRAYTVIYIFIVLSCLDFCLYVFWQLKFILNAEERYLYEIQYTGVAYHTVLWFKNVKTI